MTTVAFIGAGNIAKAIMGGYFKADPKATIWAADPVQAQLDSLPDNIHSTTNNAEAIKSAELVVLCVKPDMMPSICLGLAPYAAGKLFISVAAGISAENLQLWLGASAAIIRCMPNTPALIGEGMTGMYALPGVSEAQQELATTLLSAVGQVAWFTEEDQLNAVTAVSGSGPAYFFLMLEAMQSAAESLDLPPEVATTLVQQTAYGAIKMAMQSDLPASKLRQNVTSPGGTTAAAIGVFNDQGFTEIVQQALEAAAARSVALSKPASEDLSED